MEIKDVKFGRTTRKDFSKVGDFIEMPNLIKVQKDSYDWFIEEGLGEVLKDISPIIDYSGFQFDNENAVVVNLKKGKK